MFPMLIDGKVSGLVVGMMIPNLLFGSWDFAAAVC
jgi:hypothetical protein